jgi:hypothetical protein
MKALHESERHQIRKKKKNEQYVFKANKERKKGYI